MRVLGVIGDALVVVGDVGGDQAGEIGVLVLAEEEGGVLDGSGHEVEQGPVGTLHPFRIDEPQAHGELGHAGGHPLRLLIEEAPPVGFDLALVGTAIPVGCVVVVALAVGGVAVAADL